MIRYVVRQGLLSLAKLFVFATLMFFLIQIIMPGDFVDQFSLFMSAGERQEMRSQLGLDLPLGQRYVQWLNKLAHLDLGASFTGGQVSDVLKSAIPPTLLVFGIGTVLAFLIGIWLGERTAWRGSGVLSRAATLGGIALFTSFPPFLAWLLSYLLTDSRNFVVMGEVGGLRGGLSFRQLDVSLWAAADLSPVAVIERMILTMLIAAAAVLVLNGLLRRRRRVQAPPLPLLLLIVAGTVGLWFALGIQALALDIVQFAWLAVLAYTLLSFGETMLIMQASMTEVMKEEYINTALAKGLPAAAVRKKHAVRNALLPVLSRLVISLPYLLTGIVIIESSVGWPGMGTAMWNALYWQNMPVVMAGLLIIGVLSLVARLVLDIVIAYLDPRIRYGGQQPRMA
jgi:peptide/nickel transport system permease protein